MDLTSISGARKYSIALVVLIGSVLLRLADKLTGAELVSIWSMAVPVFMGANILQAIGVAVAGATAKKE